MAITKFTPAVCKKLRTDIDRDLAALGEKHGLKIHAGNASYTENSVTFKVECLLDGFDKQADDFGKSCFLFDLSEDAYGKHFKFRGQTYALVGLKPRSPKYPIIGARAGNRYKLPEEAVASLQEKS